MKQLLKECIKDENEIYHRVLREYGEKLPSLHEKKIDSFGSGWDNWLESDNTFIIRISTDLDEVPTYLRVLPWDHPTQPFHYSVYSGWIDDRKWIEWSNVANSILEKYDLIKVLTRYGQTDDAKKFLVLIPDSVKKICKNYGYLQLVLLQLVARYEYAHQLLISNPNLIWLFTHYYYKHRFNVDVCNILRKKKSEIFCVVTGSTQCSRAMIRLLEKYRHDNFNSLDSKPALFELLDLKDAAVSSSVIAPWFSQYRFVTKTIIDYALKYQCNSYVKVLWSAINDQRFSKWDSIAHLISRAWDSIIAEQSYSAIRMNQLNKVSSFDQLCAVYFQWRKADTKVLRENAEIKRNKTINHLLQQGDVDEAFPVLNFQNNDSRFSRIHCPRDLYDEAKAMNHCIYLYKDKASNVGDLHAYFSVSLSERLTLAISQNNDKTWSLQQLRGKENAKPTRESVVIVEKWLKEINSKIINIKNSSG